MFSLSLKICTLVLRSPQRWMHFPPGPPPDTSLPGLPKTPGGATLGGRPCVSCFTTFWENHVFELLTWDWRPELADWFTNVTAVHQRDASSPTTPTWPGDAQACLELPWPRGRASVQGTALGQGARKPCSHTDVDVDPHQRRHQHQRQWSKKSKLFLGCVYWAYGSCVTPARMPAQQLAYGYKKRTSHKIVKIHGCVRSRMGG